MAVVEPEILIGRRAFPKAQELLAGNALGPSQTFSLGTGWHGTDTHPETGAFALVDTDSGNDELIGEILHVSLVVGDKVRGVYVYCLGSASLPTPLSLTRRAFGALGLLTLESLTCTVEVVE